MTAIVGRLADVGLRQEGEQAVRGFAGPRMRGETLDQMLGPPRRCWPSTPERFGPSPFPTLGLVVAEGETPGGHSPPGLVYLQVRPPALRSRGLSPTILRTSATCAGFFLAHETAHQWWGEGMAPANYRERWLSEAWAQYSAALWLRERLGEGAFRGMMDRMARWATRFDSSGPIHLGQRLGHLEQDGRVFRAVVYDKGAWVLHMLRGVVGDEAFFAGARAFLERFRYGKAGTEDFRVALEDGERARPAPLLRAVDLRDRPPGAPLVLPDGEDRRRLPNDDRRPTAGPAGPRASPAVDGDGNREARRAPSSSGPRAARGRWPPARSRGA